MKRPTSTRLTAAGRLAAVSSGDKTIDVTADPAPYDLPPIDLFTWRIVLVPPVGSLNPAGFTVRPTDDTRGIASPISWANKPFDIVFPGRRS